MERYCKNEKSFVYAVFSSHDSEQAIAVLQKIKEAGICFWFSEQFSKKEIKRIEAAYSCIIFISNHSILDEKVRHCIQYAVKYNKKILCIYLEPTPLSPGLELLLNSLQSVDKGSFLNDQDFLEKLKSAEVFSGMQITAAQKKFAKRRALASVFVPIASTVAIFFAVVVPLLVVPMVQAANGSLSRVGFGNLSLSELAKVQQLNVVGTQPYEMTYKDLVGMAGLTHLEIANEPITDIAFAAYLPNLEVIILSGSQITDLSPLIECPKLKTVQVTTDMLPMTLPTPRSFEVEVK